MLKLDANWAGRVIFCKATCVSMPPSIPRDPLFGIDCTALINFYIMTPIPNSGPHHHWIDSYRLEENDAAGPIRTEKMSRQSPADR